MADGRELAGRLDHDLSAGAGGGDVDLAETAASDFNATAPSMLAVIVALGPVTHDRQRRTREDRA